MPIEFRCESCTKLLRTPDESAGKKAKCPQCGTIVDVPAGAAPSSDGPTPPAATQLFGATPETSNTESAANPFATMGAPGGVPDSQNPYASPSLNAGAQPAKPAALGELTPQKISFDDVLHTSWSITLDNLGPMAIFGLVMFGINIAMAIFNQAINFGAQLANEPAILVVGQLFTMAVNFGVQSWIAVASIMFCTRLARNRQSDLGVLSQAGPYVPRALGLSFVLFGIFIIIASIFVGAPAAVAWIATQDGMTTAIAAGVGGLVGGLPMAVITFTFLLSMFFIVDRKAGIFEAMGQSRVFMRGNKLTAFLTLLVMSILGWIFVIFTCCMGRIIYDPFSILVWSLIYLTATGQAFDRPAK